MSQAPKVSSRSSSGEVDIDAPCLAVAPGGVVDDLLELGGILGRPGARGCKRQVFALGGPVSQGRSWPFYPLLARAPMAALERPGQARS